MAQDYRGFLTETQRDYLRGDRDIGEHSNPSMLKRRIRERMAGAQRDWELLARTEFEFDNPLRDKSNHLADPAGIPDARLSTGYGAMQAQAEAYEAGESTEITDNQLREAAAGDMDLDSIPETFAEKYVEQLEGAGMSDEQKEALIENWPTKEQLREKAGLKSE